MQRVIATIEQVNVVMGVLSGLTTLLITLIIVADVSMRALFTAPIAGATETSTLLMIALVYLGLASVQVQKANFRVEVVLTLLPPSWRRWLDLVVTMLSAVAIGIFAWYTSGEALRSFLRNEVEYGAIDFPVWPARIIIAFGLILLMLQLVGDCARLLFGAAWSRYDDDDKGVLH